MFWKFDEKTNDNNLTKHTKVCILCIICTIIIFMCSYNLKIASFSVIYNCLCRVCIQLSKTDFLLVSRQSNASVVKYSYKMYSVSTSLYISVAKLISNNSVYLYWPLVC